MLRCDVKEWGYAYAVAKMVQESRVLFMPQSSLISTGNPQDNHI